MFVVLLTIVSEEASVVIEEWLIGGLATVVLHR